MRSRSRRASGFGRATRLTLRPCSPCTFRSMRLRFSCVAFVPPDAQLGVVGSPSFLGSWDPHRCVPLLPYSAPSEGGIEPSLWFADVEVGEEDQDEARSLGASQEGCNSHKSAASSDVCRSFRTKLLVTMNRLRASTGGKQSDGEREAPRSPPKSEIASLAAFEDCRIDHRAPEIAAVLELHPLRQVQFEYKFILWTPKRPPTPYAPVVPGEGFASSGYGSSSCTWSRWLFPPPPAQRTEPPPEGLHVVWEGTGPCSNRNFSFDPLDVVVDECSNGKLEVLYLCKVARFEDPRGELPYCGGHTSPMALGMTVCKRSPAMFLFVPGIVCCGSPKDSVIKLCQRGALVCHVMWLYGCCSRWCE